MCVLNLYIELHVPLKMRGGTSYIRRDETSNILQDEFGIISLVLLKYHVNLLLQVFDPQARIFTVLLC